MVPNEPYLGLTLNPVLYENNLLYNAQQKIPLVMLTALQDCMVIRLVNYF